MNVRFCPAELESGRQLVEIPQAIGLLADLRTRCRKRDRATIAAKKTWSTVGFHKGLIYTYDISSI